MKLVKQSAELLPWSCGIEGVYKMIELAGRTCYKSTDKITDDSAKPFVDRMIASHHTAMLEHGTVYLKFDNEQTEEGYHGMMAIERYKHNPYSRVSYSFKEDGEHEFAACMYVTTNLRVLVENNWLDDLKYICKPTEHHEKRYTIKFITDRGVSHELVRHRVFSFAQESTRYCNYSKDKFGNEITFIKPSWYAKFSKDLLNEDGYRKDGTTDMFTSEGDFEETLVDCEGAYIAALEAGATPQQARQVLPNALKTEIVMTGFASDWRYFFDLRLFGKTGAPHPDMKELAEKAKAEAEKNGIWDDIMKQPSKFK